MENCLVKTLKGTVQNDSLLKIGETAIKFDVATTVSDDYLAINVQPLNNKTIKVYTKNGTFMNSDYSVADGTEKTFAPGNVYTLRVSNTGTTLIIADKYNIRISPAHGSFDHKGIHFNLDDTRWGEASGGGSLSYRGFSDMTGNLHKCFNGAYTAIELTNCFSFGGSINGDFSVAQGFNCNSTHIEGKFANSFIDNSKTNITTLDLQNSAVSDDIANFPLCSALNVLRISGSSKITGNIANLQHMDSLTRIEISNLSLTGSLPSLYVGNNVTDLYIDGMQGVNGSLEDFAQACVNRGRTSGTLKVLLTNTSVTYNGELAANVNPNWKIVFSGSGYTITPGWT